MTVNELARRAGIPAHVVRYYTQCGLLIPARNARNAYREYRETDLHRLRFICKVKMIGLTLSEIDMIPVNQLEGVEIYVGMQIPPEYLRARGPCAVVLFWTRPGSGGLLTIPRIIAGAIIVTGILLFSRQPP